MMQSYLETKAQYKDCILFYRLGDFYEMFFEDAVTVSRELELTLTGKACGISGRAAMCGVPHHALEGYLTRLVEKGYRVAICEQVEDPKMAKGLVKREVIRIVTPGTNIDSQSQDATKNNYLMGIVERNGIYGISTVDVSTGDYYVTEVATVRGILDEIYKFSPSEIICNPAFLSCGIDLEELRGRYHITVAGLAEWYYDTELCAKALMGHFHTGTLAGLGLSDYTAGCDAAGAVLQYLLETQKNSLEQLNHITPYATNRYMVLDTSTRRNLELVETLREKTKRGSLLWVLDKTKTAMGARLLRNFIEQPLIDPEEIRARHDALAELNEQLITRDELREYLDAVYDLERLMGKVSYRSANPRDLLAFSSSLAMLPPIRLLLGEARSEELRGVYDGLDPLGDLYDLIKRAIDPEAPISVTDGGIIRTGYHADVDELRSAKTEGKNWIAQVEQREREKTGIKNLRIKYNKVFGYYLEVTNSFKELVPPDWTRKATTTGAERYITPELKELEDKILNAEEKLTALEYELFSEIRDKIAGEVARIQRTAKAVAKLDVFASLAFVAERGRFVRPQVNTEGVIEIKEGRHPVVERMLDNDAFVANDTYLDNDTHRLAIITGPNMAGKSTYMRQTALIVLMAQIGSFVPAAAANIGIVDRIFTRVGASDDLASGQSTFMVEMTEVANILRNATKNSLLILDEIGRGTSTFDGLSIAWAVAEHINNPANIGAKTLFATHYHELTELEGKLDGVNNYCIAVKESGEDIVFLRKIIKGGADKSYGIQVARLAGVPGEVLDRALEIAGTLNENEVAQRARMLAEHAGEAAIAAEASGNPNPTAGGADLIPAFERKDAPAKPTKNGMGKPKAFVAVNHGSGKIKDYEQLSFFTTPEENPVIWELKSLELANMTPLGALNKLYELQALIKEHEPR
ncbi:MAG: DNA mismatch repair protein MutS [Lachnospiraceae bacterium]|nr:DNA mismatch repair protein MutS [Lachnospiraceae bacterium]